MFIVWQGSNRATNGNKTITNTNKTAVNLRDECNLSYILTSDSKPLILFS